MTKWCINLHEFRFPFSGFSWFWSHPCWLISPPLIMSPVKFVLYDTHFPTTINNFNTDVLFYTVEYNGRSFLPSSSFLVLIHTSFIQIKDTARQKNLRWGNSEKINTNFTAAFYIIWTPVNVQTSNQELLCFFFWFEKMSSINMNNSTANQTSALWDENHQWRGCINVHSLKLTFKIKQSHLNARS